MINILNAIKYIWIESKSFIFLSFLLKVFEGMSPYFGLIVTTRLVNEISKSIINSFVNIEMIAILLTLQLLFMATPPILRNIFEFFNLKVSIKIDFYIQSKVLEHVKGVPYSFFDSPEFYNHLNRIRSNKLGQKVMYPYLGCLEILSGSISVVSIFVFLWNIHFGIAILGLLTAFPVLLISSNFEKGKFNLMKNQISRSRELDYLQGLLQSKDSIKEIRTFSLADYLLQKWKRLFFINNNEILKLNKTNQIHKIFVQVFNVLCYGFAYLIVINLLKKGALKIGNFVAIPQGVQGLQGGVTKISSNIANINSTKFYIEDYYQFINMKVPETQTEEETESFPVSIQKGIHIKNVSFSYWKSKKMVLKNVSLSIKPNEKVAIVGENGSGKSTLVKCLLGLYFVQHGNIEIDGIDIKKIDIEDLRENITALYQDYIKYDYSVHDNIAFGNVKRAKDKELVKQIASENGVDDFVRFFEKGYETRLGRLLGDGEELSGGQWQKIALARALIRDAQVVILDEPTAAFDPKSEYNFYKNFSDLTSNKIVVYISHRMSTAKLADKIVLMKDGRIVEIGSHQELINKREEYFDMYQKQYQMYG